MAASFTREGWSSMTPHFSSSTFSVCHLPSGFSGLCVIRGAQASSLNFGSSRS